MRSSAACVFLASLACGLTLWSFQSDLGDRPPVPYLAPNGSIPPGNADRRVFLDPITGDAVVLFRSANDTNEAAPQRIHVELNRHIDPSIQIEVNYYSSTKEWQYNYTLANARKARQAAVSWYFKGLTSDVCSVSVPEAWHYLFPTVLRNPEWPRLVVAANGSSTKSNLEVGVPPGAEVTGFVFKSKLAPGIGEIYVQGKSHIIAFPVEPDDATANEFKLVYGFPYNYRKTQTLIPKIETSHTSQQISDEYLIEIRRCEELHNCSEEFARNAAALLKQPSLSLRRIAVENLRREARSPLEKEFAKIFQFVLLPN